MKFLITCAAVCLVFSTTTYSKGKTPEVPRGTFHVNDIEEAKKEAVKKKLPICYMVG